MIFTSIGILRDMFVAQPYNHSRAKLLREHHAILREKTDQVEWGAKFEKEGKLSPQMSTRKCTPPNQPPAPAGTGLFNTVFHVMKTFVSSNDSPHQILLYCDSFCEFGTKRINFCKFALSFEMFLQRMTRFWLSQKQCYCPVKKWEKCTFTSRSRMPVVFYHSAIHTLGLFIC